MFGLNQKQVGSIPSARRESIQKTEHGAQQVCIKTFLCAICFSHNFYTLQPCLKSRPYLNLTFRNLEMFC